MKESNLKIAQKDIDDALKTVEDIVSVLDNTDLPKICYINRKSSGIRKYIKN